MQIESVSQVLLAADKIMPLLTNVRAVSKSERLSIDNLLGSYDTCVVILEGQVVTGELQLRDIRNGRQDTWVTIVHLVIK